MFQIPWKHAAKHGWDMEKDACLFRSWAIHTGQCQLYLPSVTGIAQTGHSVVACYYVSEKIEN